MNTKTFFALLFFATMASAARTLKHMQTVGYPITFINNCGQNIKIAKYGVMSNGLFECTITPEKTQIIPVGESTVDEWATFQSYIDEQHDVKVYNQSGFLVSGISYYDIMATGKTCDEDPPENNFIPTSKFMFLCTMFVDENGTNDGSHDEVHVQVEPQEDYYPFVGKIMVKNNCPFDIIVDNLFKNMDENSTNDVLCPESYTMSPKSSFFIWTSDVYYSFLSYTPVVQKIQYVPAFSMRDQEMFNQSYATTDLYDIGESHTGCGTSFDHGGNYWFEYYIADDVINFCKWKTCETCLDRFT